MTENFKRVGPPTKAYLATLTGMSQKHYTMLERACVEAYLLKQTHVTIIISHLTKLPPDFPNRVGKRKREGRLDYIVVRANSLLKWLNKHGHSELTGTTIRLMALHFHNQTKELLNELEC